jgi:hypothetical protein
MGTPATVTVDDPAWRAARARKAAKASADRRAARDAPRDRGIYLAYRWLQGDGKPLTKAEEIEAIAWLTQQGHGVNLPDNGTGPLRFLGKVTGLTKQRIHAIVTKYHAKNKA